MLENGELFCIRLYQKLSLNPKLLSNRLDGQDEPWIFSRKGRIDMYIGYAPPKAEHLALRLLALSLEPT